MRAKHGNATPPNRNTAQGRKILLEQAKARKLTRQSQDIDYQRKVQKENDSTSMIVWVVLMLAVGMIVYLTRGVPGLIRWLNH